jgi:hypothetical protein
MSTGKSRPVLLLAVAAAFATAACDGSYPDTPQANTAVIKFCNDRVGPNNRPVELTLEIGSPSIRISAMTGTCAPNVGKGCMAIPAGSAVSMTLREDGRQLTSQLLEVHDGEEWIVVAYQDAPILGGGELLAEFPCATFDWDKLQ